DLKRMGALRRYMPVTYGTFLVGWLAIAGVPPLSGFWAKGDVLVNAFSKSPALWAVAAVTAVLTAYYMGREFFLAFYGRERWRAAGLPAPHESPWVMRAPLLILGFFAAFGGLLNLPFHPNWTILENWLAPVVGANLFHPSVGTGGQWALEITDAVLAIAGVLVAGRAWGRQWERPALEPLFLRRGWGIDSAIDALIGRPSERLAAFSATEIEGGVIDGAVNGVAASVRAGGGQLRKLQTGFVRNYALGIAAGVVLILAFLLSRAVT
ncbi:MAG: proton-conducting transporter membrane subunit, partial [Candidatus Dormibacteria bacterium]